MSNRTAITSGYPYAYYRNENSTHQRIRAGSYVNETSAQTQALQAAMLTTFRGKSGIAPTTALSAIERSAFRGKFGPFAGTVPLSAKGLTAFRSSAGLGLSNAVALFGRMLSSLQGNFGPARGTVPLTGAVLTLSKSSAGLAGTVPLTAKLLASVKAAASSVGHAALYSKVLLSFKAVPGPTFLAGLKGVLQTKASAKAGLSGRTALSASLLGLSKGAGVTFGYVALFGKMLTKFSGGANETLLRLRRMAIWMTFRKPPS